MNTTQLRNKKLPLYFPSRREGDFRNLSYQRLVDYFMDSSGSDLSSFTPQDREVLNELKNLAGEWSLVKPAPIRPGALSSWEYLDAAISPTGYFKLIEKYPGSLNLGDFGFWQWIIGGLAAGGALYLKLWNSLKETNIAEEKQDIKSDAWKLYTSGQITLEEYQSILLEEPIKTNWQNYLPYILAGGGLLLFLLILILKK